MAKFIIVTLMHSGIQLFTLDFEEGGEHFK
jgi:hypothetical protein